MLYVKNANNIEPNARIEDFQTIKEIANKCGYNVRSTPAPAHKHTTDHAVSIAEYDFISY